MFGNTSLTLGSPWYLLLLLLLAPVWLLSVRGMRSMGPWRQWSAIVIRSLVLLLLVATLAQPMWVQQSDKLTVIYLLDQSASIPEPRRREIIRYVNHAITEQRENEDRVGVIAFGKDAAMEIPAWDYAEGPIPESLESLIDQEYTNLEGAMKLAQGTFEHDTARRIVVVSDGKQNIGNAKRLAGVLADQGIGIDAVPIFYENIGEAIVEKLTMPAGVAKGQPFQLRTVITNTSEQPIPGRLILTRTTGDQPITLNSNEGVEQGSADDPQRVVLQPGKNVYELRQEITQPHFYKYGARFIPDNPAHDGMVENNAASTFTHVRGEQRVLLIYHGDEGQHVRLINALRDADLEVTLKEARVAYSSSAELQQYDTVILADVPRTAEDENIEHFTDSQIRMLVNNTRYVGSGLVVIGGPDSFGAGGWTNTELEKAMPVDFDIKNAKVVAKGALAMVMHACELPDGNHWQKRVGEEALKTLGSRDWAGVVEWNGQERWLWDGMREIGRNKRRMMNQLSTMTPGDMPDFDAPLRMMLRGFNALPKGGAGFVKHAIVISDGDPSPASARTLAAFKEAGVTISTVAIGTHGPAGHREMQRVANVTNGNYYIVKNSTALPRIFQKEARQVTRPLVHENEKGIYPTPRFGMEMLEGIDINNLPRLTGYVLTSVKDAKGVELGLMAPEPAGRDNTILAGWQYGLGKAVCFTSDSGSKWANAWTSWDGYDKFFTQMVRWSMRSNNENGDFTIAQELVDGKVKVVVTALDADDEFLNQLDIVGTALGPPIDPDNPNTAARNFSLRQVAPGRYEGEFSAEETGNYLVTLIPGRDEAPLMTGISVPYSAEYRERGTDEALLASMASQTPTGGQPGTLLAAPRGTGAQALTDFLALNPFRHDLPKAESSQKAWHFFLLLACCLFLADVFVRRVQVHFYWLPPLLAKVRDTILRRESAPAEAEYISRLQSRKREIASEIEFRRAATRFEPEKDAPPEVNAVREAGSARGAPPSQRTPAASAELTPQKEEDTYTNRLLKAKKQVWKDRKE
ncbi:MAG: VWA domain-containing protein [Pirellulales bacterium]|nr:VWA domain-containing protein [Pirellulales bacterium]